MAGATAGLRRRVAPLLAGVVVVAVVALVVGLLGLPGRPGAGLDGARSEGRPQPLRLVGAAGGAAGDAARGGDEGTAALGAPTSMRMPAWYGGRLVLGTTLDDERPPDAPVYRFTRTAVDERVVRRLATVLGLGEPRRTRSGWVATRGTARLWMPDGPTFSWTYGRDAACSPLPPDDAPDTAVSSPAQGCAAVVGTRPGSRLPAVPPPPSVGESSRLASPLLAALGLDGGAARVVVRRGSVSADPVVDGLPTVGLATWVAVDRSGVTAASGWVGAPRRGASYPLLSAKDGYAALAVPALGAPEIASMPCRPAKDRSRCLPPPDRVVTGARLGLLLSFESGRESGSGSGAIAPAPVLLPAWLFDVRGEDDPLAAIAVRPRYLQQPQTPGKPTEAPGAGGGAAPGSTGSAGSGTKVPYPR